MIEMHICLWPENLLVSFFVEEHTAYINLDVPWGNPCFEQQKEQNLNFCRKVLIFGELHVSKSLDKFIFWIGNTMDGIVLGCCCIRST